MVCETFNKRNISRRSLLASAPIAAFLAASPAAHAETINSFFDEPLTPAEEALINETAAGFEEVYRAGGLVVEGGKFQKFDIDHMFALLDQGKNVNQVVHAMATHHAASVPGKIQPLWNGNRFGRCMSKKLGIADVKAVIKAFSEPQVRAALKSRQWKKASSIAFNILKHMSPKLAKELIKRAAHYVLPGGAVGALALSLAQCSLGELELW